MHRCCTAACLVLALLPHLPAQSILPPPPVPAGNPQTPQKELLGKALFWDEQLSSSRTLSCGTCHIFERGGSDPRSSTALHPGPDGIFGTADDRHGSPGVVRHDAQGAFVADPLFGIRPQVTSRLAPSPINAAYERELFWDGRAGDVFRDPVTQAVVLPAGGALESQIAGPPVSDVEMSHMGRTWSDIAADIAPLEPLALADQIPPALQAFVQGQTYATLFQQVFGSPGVTPVRIIFALAAYERSLISDQSPFDRYLAGQGSLTAAQARGFVEFQGLCASCHTDVLPSALTAGPGLNDFRNIGVRPIGDDAGRQAVTNDARDAGKFKTPGMRNVALRGRWFHNGGAASLREVIDFYARGGDFYVNQDPLVASMPGQISAQDILDLLDFLRALTDPRLVQGIAPFDRPRLWSESANVPVVFGQGTAGSGGAAPGSIAVLPAYLGNPHFTLGVDRALPGALHYLVLDVAANQVPAVILGQNVYLALTPAHTPVAVPQLVQGAAPGTGYSSLTFPIPQQPGLRGMTVFGQWLVFDPQGPFGVVVSDALGFPVF